MNYKEHALPAIAWSVETQEYQLTAGGDIDYTQPIGTPQIENNLKVVAEKINNAQMNYKMVK
ncbi:hypothetical protein [Bacillus wiedmannii]|uniref:hypothetical protein n=1 Tax=Bacillus wiedmannii TaxID=1890302 RepID=UPI000BEBF0D0|nr:hypothetical protein [Bacillus wiedmannii]PEF34040.1 hypothetical protein CON72_21725 [Bacillus wiedmannii]